MQQINLIHLAEKYGIVLNKVGKLYQGLCPFHEEDTPSFTIYEDTNTYYCYGCKASGDWKKFLMHVDPEKAKSCKVDVLNLQDALDRASLNVRNSRETVQLISAQTFNSALKLRPREKVMEIMRFFDEAMENLEFISPAKSREMLDILHNMLFSE